MALCDTLSLINHSENWLNKVFNLYKVNDKYLLHKHPYCYYVSEQKDRGIIKLELLLRIVQVLP